MRELTQVLRSFEQARREGEACVLATIVRASGSTYRRAGARMLVSGGRWLAGSISGGCLEADILRKAAFRTEAGKPVRVRYDSSGDDDAGPDGGFGLGCRGVVEVLLERVGPEDEPPAIAFPRRALALGKPAALVTVFAAERPLESLLGARLLCADGALLESTTGDGALVPRLRENACQALLQGRGRSVALTLNGSSVEAAVEIIRPPVPLVLFGQGHDVAPVVELAAGLGWQVTVVENRHAGASRREFPGAARVLRCGGVGLPEGLSIGPDALVVLMTHSFARDRSLLPDLFASRARYIGVLGPRRRTERLLGELSARGIAITPALLSRLHGPVGLDLGADSPEEIALSIVSELQAVIAGRDGCALRLRAGPIHPAPEAHAAPVPASPLDPGEIRACDP